MLLKLIAFGAMLVDHSAVLLFHDPYWMHMVGRLAFPIFSYLIVYNYLYRTRSKEKYLFSVALLGIVSQPVYAFALQGSTHFNIIILLATGLVLLYMIELIEKKGLENRHILMHLLIIGAALKIAGACEYGHNGVEVILGYYLLERFRHPLFVVMTLAALLLQTVWTSSLWAGVLFAYLIVLIQHYTRRLDAVIPYRRSSKWFYYLFYPLHLGILGLLSQPSA